MILSAGVREVRGEGVGCWAGLDEVDLGGFLGLGDGGVRRNGRGVIFCSGVAARDVRARLGTVEALGTLGLDLAWYGMG